ncbi:hypothetical protein ISCGN_023197 [Ixodes scapularis]
MSKSGYRYVERGLGPPLHATKQSVVATTTQSEEECNTSDRGLGVVLCQKIKEKEHPILYASRRLTTREEAYSASEKECACLVWAVQKLSCYLAATTARQRTTYPKVMPKECLPVELLTMGVKMPASPEPTSECQLENVDKVCQFRRGRRPEPRVSGRGQIPPKKASTYQAGTLPHSRFQHLLTLMEQQDSRLREAGAEVVYCLARGAPKGPNLPRARLNHQDALFPRHGKATHSQTWAGEPAWLGVRGDATLQTPAFTVDWRSRQDPGNFLQRVVSENYDINRDKGCSCWIADKGPVLLGCGQGSLQQDCGPRHYPCEKPGEGTVTQKSGGS